MVKHVISASSILVAAVIIFSSPARAELNVNVNLGIPLPSVVFKEPPEFILPSALGFYVAVGVPHDLFYVNGSYYLMRNNNWYLSSYYDGPWKPVKYKRLPDNLRRHSYEKIRYHRDREYSYYRKNNHKYKGRYYRPERRHPPTHERFPHPTDNRPDRGRKHNDRNRDLQEVNPWKNNR